MKLREVVYWVVILLQLVLITGVKEKEVSCWHCAEPGFPSEMIDMQPYGMSHVDCFEVLPKFDDSELEKPVREEYREPRRVLATWQ